MVVGGLLALAATLIGCVFAFFYARFLGRDLVIRKFGSRLEKINRVLEKNPMSMTLIIRFLPFGSNIVTNLVAGVSSIPVLWFLLGSLVGYLPQTFIFALLGKGVLEDPLWTTLLSAALLAISIFIGIALYRKYKLQDVLSDD
ncbi:MAG: DedA family protein [Desulfovibrio sp.]|nr:MAG: DedA family protein [Desulfovibrio sp.]